MTIGLAVASVVAALGNPVAEGPMAHFVQTETLLVVAVVVAADHNSYCS